MGEEAQSDEEVCVAHGIQYKTRGVRGVREVAHVGEGPSCALGEEREYLALQCSCVDSMTPV
jgi:hypothetical protein